MLYKNTFKIMFSNSSLIWKLLLYFLIALMLVVGLAFVVALPIYRVLVAEGFFEAIRNTYLDFITSLNLKVLFENIFVLATDFFEIIVNNFSSLVVYIVLFLFILIILGGVLINFYNMPASSSVNMYMNSNVKQGFMTSFFAVAKNNLKYNLVYLLILLPINLAVIFLTLYSLKLFKMSGILLAFAPFIIIIGFTILNGIKTTLFCGWVPAMITQNKGVWAGLKNSFVVAKRRFIQTFANSVTLTVTIIFINVFGGLCTFGVALFITIPASFLLSCIFNMVAYYTAIGQRFYVDPYNVIAPKTLEHTEKIKNQKYIV